MNDPTPFPEASLAAQGPSAGTALGALDLQQVLGSSRRTMAWRAVRRDDGARVVVVAPRVPPRDAATLAQWAQAVRRASRLDHPQLPRPLALGVQSGWPYVAYPDNGGGTLASRMGPALTPRESAYMVGQAAVGVAFAHESGVAHGDLQPYLVQVTDAGKVEVLGLEIGADPAPAGMGAAALADDGAVADAGLARRLLMRRDVTTLGVLLHQVLAVQPALEEPDVTEAVLRLPPTGRETLRLPWLHNRVIPQPLRVVADRATDRQEARRYLSARTLVRSLEEWLQAETLFGTDVFEVLGEKIRKSGLLPTTPGSADRVARMAMMESERTQDLAEVILEDPALAFELLRQVNVAQERSVSGMGAGPVLTVRRAIALLGLQGVRRAALSLRPWPGPLDATFAGRLRGQMERCRFAARVAQAIRPKGFDAEAVYLVTLLQSLGALAIRYHLPAEAAQIEAVASERASEETGELVGDLSASLAVLGVEFEAVAAYIVRSWGMGPTTVRVMRRMPLATHVHTGGSDDEVLRATASCALEAVEATNREPSRRDSAIARVAHRYATALGLSEKDLRWAVGELGPGSYVQHDDEGEP